MNYKGYHIILDADDCKAIYHCGKWVHTFVDWTMDEVKSWIDRRS